MTGRFLNGLAIVLVLGIGLTSSFVIDDPYPSETEKETLEEMTDEMNKLDDLNVRHALKEKVEDVSVDVENEYKLIVAACKLEGKTKVLENEVQKKHDEYAKALRKLYQILQHGKKSIIDDLSWLEARRSEICSACVLRKICEKAEIIGNLGIDPSLSDKKKVRQCKQKVLAIAKSFHYVEEEVKCKPRDVAPYRRIDGRCNNLDNPLWGSVGDVFLRLFPADYGDCVSTLRRAKNGEELPNARNVSRFVHGSNEDRSNPDSEILTHLTMNWGQFMDHDITLAEAQGLNCEPENPNPECINIVVPFNDDVFQSRGVTFFEVERDAAHKPSVDCKLGCREHSNAITAYVDGSNVYGSTEELALELRAADGLMRVMKHPHGCPMANLLPAQPPDVFCVSKDPLRPCFQAGDERTNENQGLMTMHTLMVREHNRIATFFGQNFPWDGERIYQETRKIIGAALQVITYNEFLTLILSKKTIRDNDLKLLKGTEYFKGYDKTVNAQMSNVFSVAAYRFGHSLIQEQFRRFSQDGFEHKCDSKEKSEFMPIPLLDFGNPTYLFDKCNGGIDSIYRGLMKDPAAKPDGRFSESVQHNLFRGPGDLSDLISINIQRGRERGVAGYTKYRNDVCKIKPEVKSFDDLEAVGFSQDQIDSLKSVYDNVHDIDAFTGVMSEPRSADGGVLGDTAQCILGDQFGRLRKGDRFWHENEPDPDDDTDKTAFNPCQLREVRKFRLAKVLCDNADNIPAVPGKPMLQTKIFVECENLPEVNLKAWNLQCDVGSASADSAHYADEL